MIEVGGIDTNFRRKLKNHVVPLLVLTQVTIEAMEAACQEKTADKRKIFQISAVRDPNYAILLSFFFNDQLMCSPCVVDGTRLRI